MVAFPQVIDMGAGHDPFVPMNILTVPCGCVCLCDTLLEVVVDTVCLPYDWPVSEKRKKERELRVFK